MTRDELSAEAEKYDALAEETADEDPVASEYYSTKARAARALAAYTPEEE